MKITIALTLFLFIGQAYGLSVKVPSDNEIVKITNPKTEEDSLSRSFRVLVWNIYKGKKKRFTSDFKSLSQDHDLLILQEAIDKKPVIDLMESLTHFESIMGISWIDTDKEEGTGVLTSSVVKAKLISWYQSVNREPILKTPKLSLMTYYNLDSSDDELAVINMHTLNFVSQKKFESMFEKTIGMVKNHRGPMIFAGDFNTWNAKRLSFMKRKLKELNLIEVTFDPDLRKTFMGKPLDHIWVRGLKIKSSKVLSELNSSDHKALSVELEVSI